MLLRRKRPLVREIRLMKLGDGDVVVLHVDKPITFADVDRLTGQMKSYFPDHTCLVVPGDMRLDVLRLEHGE